MRAEGRESVGGEKVLMPACTGTRLRSSGLLCGFAMRRWHRRLIDGVTPAVYELCKGLDMRYAPISPRVYGMCMLRQAREKEAV